MTLARWNAEMDEIFVVRQRAAELSEERIGGTESECDQNAWPRRISAGNLLELNEIGATGAGVLVNAVEMRFVPKARTLQFGRPAGAAGAQVSDSIDEVMPVVTGTGRRGCFGQCHRRIG